MRQTIPDIYLCSSFRKDNIFAGLDVLSDKPGLGAAREFPERRPTQFFLG
jgi:hypothetical protein